MADSSRTNSVHTILPQSDKYQATLPQKRPARDVGEPNEGRSKRFLQSVKAPRSERRHLGLGINPPTLFQRNPLPQDVPPLPVRRHGTEQAERSTDPALVSYIEVMEVDQAGPCTVVHEKKPTHSFFVIKKKRVGQEQRARLLLTEHKNIVNLKSFMPDGGCVQLVYEFCRVSLSDILGSLAPPFSDFEKAAIANQVRFEWFLG